jgi:hypothetical protein
MTQRIGALLATLLGLALLVYSAARSLDFISMTLPGNSQVLAYFGLAALDGGLVAWLLAFLHGSKGSWQRAVSILMVIVDFVGCVAMFTMDTIYNTGKTGLTTGLTEDQIWTAVIGLSAIIALNIAATVVFHITDPTARQRQAEEEAQDRIEDAAIASVNKNASFLAAELAPQMADDWMRNMRARYQHAMRALPAPTDQVRIPGLRYTEPNRKPEYQTLNAETVTISPNGHKPGETISRAE